MTPNVAPIRRDTSFPFCGRLMAMPTSRSASQGQFISDADRANLISIDFPGMPDSIELARSVEYTVLNNQILPDGVHMYKSTKPLEIPFSFRVHAFDKAFCPRGSFTLLQLAARLHSFTLPIDASGGAVAITASAGAVEGNSETALEKRAVAPDGGIGFRPTGHEKVFAPVTCRLELIFTEQDAPGIACIGYVREVSAKLNGPWLRGPGRSANLPSSGDFSFVFVHRPGHGNAFNMSATDFDLQPQAYAHTVRDRLYNTHDLSHAINYQGFDDVPAVKLLTP